MSTRIPPLLLALPFVFAMEATLEPLLAIILLARAVRQVNTPLEQPVYLVLSTHIQRKQPVRAAPLVPLEAPRWV